MPTRFKLPDHLVAAAHEFGNGGRTPVEPRNAATVVLLRNGSRGLSVYLLRRQTSMAFAGGMCVFPGGGVDPRDSDPDIAWAGPPASQWARQLGTDEETAQALVCAAVRETFEESGVLLAGETPDTVVADTTAADWERDRAALEAKELAFTDFLTRRRLVLRTDLLGVWAAWLTPIFEPRRYRTWFFVADLPEGQRTRDVSTESDGVVWLPIESALAGVESEQIGMLPPTYLTCLEAAQCATTQAVLEAAQDRQVEVFTPQAVLEDGDWMLSVPDRLRELLRSRTALTGR